MVYKTVMYLCILIGVFAHNSYAMNPHDHIRQTLISDIGRLETQLNYWRSMSDDTFAVEIREATDVELKKMTDESKAYAKVIYIDRLQNLLHEKEAQLKEYNK